MKKKLNCILLIDDDEPTNYINRMLIEEAACTEHIHIVQTGQSALDYLTSSKQVALPDLIFVDINMPAMNGWEFLDKYNKLRQSHKGEIVIVMLTTSLNPDDEIKATEMPCVSGFENKPLTSEKLDRIFRKYFPSYFF